MLGSSSTILTLRKSQEVSHLDDHVIAMMILLTILGRKVNKQKHSETWRATWP